MAADEPVCAFAVQVYREVGEPGGEGGAKAAWRLPELGEPVRDRGIAIPLGNDGPHVHFCNVEVHH